jgi:ankyrin repeat protein
MSEWYYAEDGRSLGPFPENELRKLFLERAITPDTLVWSAALGGPGAEWIRAADAAIFSISRQRSRSRTVAPRKTSRGKFLCGALALLFTAALAAIIFAVANLRPLDADEFFKLCESGSAEEIISALERKTNPLARPDVTGGEISAPLIAAILTEKIDGAETISAFARAGADMNVTDGSSGFSALIYAAIADKPALIRELIRSGADVNARDNDGCSALMYAITGNQRDVVAELLDGGADVNARDNLGRSAFSLALNPSVDSAIAIGLINRGGDVNEFTTFRDDWRVSDVSALMLAIINRCAPDVITALLERGADVNAETKYGDTALMYAIAQNNNPAITISLIERGADVNKKYLVHHGAAFRYTALMWAILHRNDVEVLSRIIKSGADVNARTKDGPSALDCALYEKYDAAIALLKKNGAKK